MIDTRLTARMNSSRGASRALTTPAACSKDGRRLSAPEGSEINPHEADQKKDQARPRQASRTSPPPDAYQGRLAPAIKKTVGLSRDDRWLAHLFPGFLPARAPPAVARPHVG
mgnify:CR=1 FL=1